MLVFDAKTVLFLQVVVVIGVPLILWRPLQLGRFFPLPIIQIFAGIALGPSILGAVSPETFAFLFGNVKDRSNTLVAGVNTLANTAAVLFVFLAGCEMDRKVVRNAAGMVLRIGVTGVFLPWVLGGLAAYLMFTQFSVDRGLAGPIGGPVLYSVAFGLCMAVTALPVLVIVLRELGFNQKPIGTIALAIGGVDDALLWLSLAVLLPFASGAANIWAAALLAAAGGVGTIVLMHYVIVPFLQRMLDQEAPERLLMSSVILILFVNAVITEATGIHAVLGAFITGLMIPDKLRHMAEDRLDVPVTLLLLPFLFLATGLKTEFSLNDPTVWIVLTVAMVVCVGGKFVGVTLPAVLSGQSFPFAATLGVLMQCKGLMEIVVVTVLYQKGVFGVTTFSALILTALISTAITAPLARLAQRIFGEEASTQTRAAPEPVAVTVGEPALANAIEALSPGGPVLVFDSDIGRVPLEKNEMVIGRHSQDDIRVNDIRVSRHHALLKALDGGGYEIHNQTAVRSEPNPVLVNGQEKEHAVLKDGDVVTVGGVTFTYLHPRQKMAA
jgi:Kef-type K+ transport system membrane component KefB